MSADTAGWTKQTNPEEFRADFRINSKEGTVNSKANAIVITNKGSGDYNVYRDNGLLEGIGDWKDYPSVMKRQITNNS